jgi:CHU_C Type IX secretion signal domain
MKPTIVAFTCLIILAGTITCRKKTKNSYSAICPTCNATSVAYKTDNAGVSYFLPNAFTPNGDGVNDLLRLVYTNVDTANTTMQIWRIDGTEVFNGKARAAWDGTDKNGKICAAGKYSVSLKIKPVDGAEADFCACVTLFRPVGCIKDNPQDYQFEDQIKPGDGVTWPTHEVFCP